VIANEAGTELYSFDVTGRHLRTTNAVTGALLWQFDYDPATGFVRKIVDGDNNTTVINRDPVLGTISIVAPYGQTTVLKVDSGTNWLTSITDPIARAVSFAPFNGTDLLGVFTDANGGQHTMTYDGLGRLQTDKSPSGAMKTLTPTQLTTGKQVDVTTVLGRKHTYRLDSVGGTTTYTQTGADGLATVTTQSADSQSTTTVAPDGMTRTTQIAPDPRFGLQAPYTALMTETTPGGLTRTTTTKKSAILATAGDPMSATSLTTSTNVNGSTWTTVEDLVAHTVTTTSPMGRTSTTTNDARGRPIGVAIPNIDPIQLTYDAQGRPQTIVQGNRTTTFAYDKFGYLAAIKDPLNQTVTFNKDAPDPVGRVLQQQLNDGTTVTFGYDPNGNITSVTPPSRPAHGFGFAQGDNLKSYDPPPVVGSGTTSTLYTPNADDQPFLVQRPDGVTLTSSYDPFGKLATLAASGAVTNVTNAFGWSPTTGLLSTLTMTTPAWSSTLARGYDGSLLTDQTWSSAVAGTYHRQFDSNFLVTSDTVAGSVASYLYDKDNLLTSAGGETLVRDPGNGLLTGTTLGTINDVIHYDEYGAVHDYTATAGSTVLYSVNYGARDPLGRLLTKTETIGGVTTTYGYDYNPTGELWHVTVNGTVTATYLYDANGNRISHDGTSTNDGAYDAQDRMTSFLGASYSYGANGELQTKTLNGQVTTYKYDAFGNVREVDLPGAAVTYVVDGQQRRVGKIVNGMLTKAWLYRDELAPIAELDGNGNLVSRFVYGSSKRVPDAIVRSGKTYRVIRDQLESPRLIVDSGSGQVVERIDYDAWGNVTQDILQPGVRALGPFGFAGGLYDADTGLVRFGARDYDPGAGRWTAKDPKRFAARDANLYRYAGGDPVNVVDVTGLDFNDPKDQCQAAWGGTGLVCAAICPFVLETGVGAAACLLYCGTAALGGAFSCPNAPAPPEPPKSPSPTACEGPPMPTCPPGQIPWQAQDGSGRSGCF
jgi:RHS repeat-associated protein